MLLICPSHSFSYTSEATNVFLSILPGFYPDACAWPGPAGRLVGCVPRHSSGRPQCRAAAGAVGSPLSPGLTGPAWSTAGGRVKTAPDPELQTHKGRKIVIKVIHTLPYLNHI